MHLALLLNFHPFYTLSVMPSVGIPPYIFIVDEVHFKLIFSSCLLLYRVSSFTAHLCRIFYSPVTNDDCIATDLVLTSIIKCHRWTINNVISFSQSWEPKAQYQASSMGEFW